MNDGCLAFVKGGCGCLVAFVIFAIIVVVLGGGAHIDLGGAVCLFAVGGLIGLIVLSVYNKGRHDAIAAREEDEAPTTERRPLQSFDWMEPRQDPKPPEG